MNWLGLSSGLVLVAASLIWTDSAWLHWNNGFVPGAYFLLQVSPILLVRSNPGSETGLPTEYIQIEETFAPEALEMIGDWIDERFGG